MTAHFLRHLVAQRPFRPCRPVLTGGTEIPVSSPGVITVPNEDTVRVTTADGHLYILDLRHVIEVRS